MNPTAPHTVLQAVGLRSLLFTVVSVLACTPISTPDVDVSPVEPVPMLEPDPRVEAELEPELEPEAPPAIEGQGVRAYDVLRHADGWLGRELVVDIYEPIRSAMHDSSAPPGGYAVDVEDVGTDILNLVPDRQALTSLPEELQPPFRIRATMRRDDDREGRSGRTWRVLEVHSLAPLTFPEAVPVDSAKAILKRPRRWHGRYVELEGAWVSGFEASYMGGIWLDWYPDVTIVCEPPPEPDGRSRRGRRTHQLRVVGYVYTRGHYGHMGSGKANLVATSVTFLDTPGCTPPR